MNGSENQRLPHFRLAPLQKIGPECLVSATGSDRMELFILALAQVFNDLKDLAYVSTCLSDAKPREAKINPYFGQWMGMNLHVHRLIYGLLFELFELLRKFEDQIRSPEFLKIERQMGSRTQRDWKALRKFALGEKGGSKTEFGKCLERIRHNLSFHYYQPKQIMRGYRRHFFGIESGPHAEFAYYSIGQNMEETRFYYADAAGQAALGELTDGDFKNFEKECLKAIGGVNQVLFLIVGQYIVGRSRAPSNYALERTS